MLLRLYSFRLEKDTYNMMPTKESRPYNYVKLTSTLFIPFFALEAIGMFRGKNWRVTFEYILSAVSHYSSWSINIVPIKR